MPPLIPLPEVYSKTAKKLVSAPPANDPQNISTMTIEPMPAAPNPFTDGFRHPSANITPDWLLNHDNRFDPNTYTPEDMIKRGYTTQNRPEVKKT
jgi:hypothetical protein